MDKRKGKVFSPWNSRHLSDHVFWKNTVGLAASNRRKKKRMSLLEQQVHDDMEAEGYTTYQDYWSSKLD